MTEEQTLLYQDMMGRIPFGLLVSPIEKESGKVLQPTRLLRGGSHEGHDKILFITRHYGTAFGIGDIKPYLRWKGDMTSDEVSEYRRRCTAVHQWLATVWYDTPESVDYLNSIFVDFRGLYEKGLAIRAPEGMYSGKKGEAEIESIPTTIEEAMASLDARMTDEDKAYIQKHGSISVHHTLGRWIRNEWGLWGDSGLKQLLAGKGIEHPDEMSDYIIQQFIEYLKNKQSEP